MEIEHHPLKPFLPAGARILLLGSFPPSRRRWSMDFFYPNFTNDAWRIWGLLAYGDKDYFVDTEHRTFRKELIEEFLTRRGIAIFDTATAVIRTRGTASDKDLQVVETTDIDALLRCLPCCTAIVTTGQKATDIASEHFGVPQPPVGGSVTFTAEGRTMQLFRMPSSSRAYPMPLTQKAQRYEVLMQLLNTDE